MNMTLLSVIITETIKKERQNMRKRIAVLMVLAIILGTVCAFAEEEEAEDLAGEWELYVGGEKIGKARDTIEVFAPDELVGENAFSDFADVARSP